MKKFLVILLSLAVLFGFAACDNSSSTPDDDDTTTTDVSYETYKAMASALANDLSTALTAGFDDDQSIVAASKASSVKYTFDGTSFTFTESKTGATERENETYSLTLNGVLLEGTGTTGRTIQLTDYEYIFSKPLNTSTQPYDFTTTTGTVSGYLDGTLEVTLNADNSLLTVDVPSTSNIKMFLPDAESKVSLFYGESELTAKADIISIMNFGVADTANPTSYAAWRTKELGTYEGEIKALVKALLTDTDANVFSTAVTDTAKATKKDYVKASYAQGTNGGSITITYSLPEDAASEVVIAGNEGTSTDKATVIKLGKGDSFTIVLSSKAGDATNSFPVDSYTITDGTFKVYKYSSTDTALVAYDTIEEFTVEGLTGAVSGLTAEKLDTDNNANANVTGAVTSASQTATAGDASAMIAVGPARDAKGAIVAENVPVEITSLS